MRTVLLTATLVLGLAVSGCTGDDVEPESSESSSAGTPGSAEPEGDSESPDPTHGPLALDDSQGKACASLRYGREYTAWEHVLVPEADVELTGLTLVGAEGVRASGEAFVAELPRRVPMTGFSLGFPPDPKVTGSRNVDWEGRRPAVGAVLEAGTSSNLWVRIQVEDGVRRAGYDGLELSYTAGGEEHTAFSDIRTRFRWRCA